MNKKYILYIALALLGLALIPQHHLDTISYSFIAAFFIYIYFKEKSQMFAKEFEVWLRNNEKIINATFNHELDKKYCRLYHDIKDPRLDRKTKELLTGDWESVLAQRKEQGLPERCCQYEQLCTYHKMYL